MNDKQKKAFVQYSLLLLGTAAMAASVEDVETVNQIRPLLENLQTVFERLPAIHGETLTRMYNESVPGSIRRECIDQCDHARVELGRLLNGDPRI